MSDQARRSSVVIEDAVLAAATWGDGPAEIVLAHDGLGSIGQWRDVPERVHDATGKTVQAYERAGHGTSTPVPAGPWPADWLHREAAVLAALLDDVAVERPLLVGHSDGGSIALLAAASGIPCAGVLALAAHSWVEQVCVDAIAAMRVAPDRIIAGLGRHHEHPAALFEAWSGVWTSAAFRAWDIRPLLGSVDVPVTIAQGDADEYATPGHVAETVAAIGRNADGMLIPGLGHLLHHQDANLVIELISSAAHR